MLTTYDERWPAAAESLMADLRRALEPLDPEVRIDHIGSTSVPGLAAKPLIDLQVRMPRLPGADVLEAALATIGFHPEAGSRPDSPGVHRDHPRGSEQVADEVWEKRLFTATQPASVLHVRRSNSPWARYTVLFRDWLRAHPEQRDAYEATKQGLAAEHGGDPDYDDYTRAKTAYFDRVQPLFEEWGRDSG